MFRKFVMDKINEINKEVKNLAQIPIEDLKPCDFKKLINQVVILVIDV